MGSIADKLNYTFAAKEDIREATVDKGVDVPSTTPLGDYGDLIEQISAGGICGKPMIVGYVSGNVSAMALSLSVEANAGDVILATVTVRSALTLPSNFNVLFTSTPVDSNQTLSFAVCRVTTSGTQSVTVSQETNERILANLIVLRNVSSVRYMSKYYAIATERVATIQAASSRPYNKNVIWAVTAPTWSTSPTKVFEADNDWYTYIGAEASTAARLANFIDFVDNKRTNVAPTFTPDATTSTMVVGAVEVEGTDGGEIMKNWELFGAIPSATSVIDLSNVWDNIDELQVTMRVAASAFASNTWSKVMGSGTFVGGYIWDTSYMACIAITVDTTNKTITLDNNWQRVLHKGSAYSVFEAYLYYR